MKRTGISLMEMAVVMSCMVFMFALTSQVLLLLWGSVRETREQTQVAASLARLGMQFRDDVHQAQRVSVDQICTLSLPDDVQVNYAFEKGNLIRSETKLLTTVHRERFVLLRNSTLEFAAEEIHSQKFVRLQLATASQAKGVETEVLPAQLSLRAALGLHVLPAAMATASDNEEAAP